MCIVAVLSVLGRRLDAVERFSPCRLRGLSQTVDLSEKNLMSRQSATSDLVFSMGLGGLHSDGGLTTAALIDV